MLTYSSLGTSLCSCFGKVIFNQTKVITKTYTDTHNDGQWRISMAAQWLTSQRCKMTVGSVASAKPHALLHSVSHNIYTYIEKFQKLEKLSIVIRNQLSSKTIACRLRLSAIRYKTVNYLNKS